jgi:HTH-type transcriptional regulator/antitoxin HigA
MAKKMIRPLRSETDYDAALKEIERYFEDEPKPGTQEADRFDLLALIIEDYERKRWPIDPPDTIDAIRYRMETGGYTQADLGRLLGSRQRASDILRFPCHKGEGAPSGSATTPQKQNGRRASSPHAVGLLRGSVTFAPSRLTR